MAKLYAVSYMDFFNNTLTVEFHRADDWQTALTLHTEVCNDPEYLESISALSLEDAKEEAFNGDWLFDVVEVPANV